MTSPVFLMVEATPNPAALADMKSYLAKAPAITKGHGGVPIASYDVESVLDGGNKPAVFAVLSFPNREAIQALFNDPAYLELVPERDRGFSQLRYYTVNERI